MALFVDIKEKDRKKAETQDLHVPRLSPIKSFSKSTQPPSSEGPILPSAKAQRQKRRILVVDDEEDYRMIVQDTLDGDYEVYTVQNGEEALAALEWMRGENNLPAVIITDKMMPIMDGDEFIAKARDAVPGLKFIMITMNMTVTEDTLIEGGKPDRLMYKTHLVGPDGLRKVVVDLLENQPEQGTE
jgi:CheY-like chemotaxis protein